MMWDALMIGTGFVAGVAGTVALAVRWYERPSQQDWCGGTDGGVYLAGYQHGRRDGDKPPEIDRDPGAVMWVPTTITPRPSQIIRWP
jgi:hypothetical protein